ncbi:unnamed protein product [Oncorhynchus mykiss]|uniref:FERM domain-containing protein n=1 Tax=Oncorhynchus mykiss TaxID=8022 RepID=A0A060XNL2_ONCMY|nr:unnamed protein product [Oncorhynchus mykiss]
MSCFCAPQEEFYCEVLLLDETKLTLTTQQQGIKKSTKGSVVLDFVFNHVNLAETDYFGLRYCDRSHQTYWLDPSKTLSEHKDLIATGPPYTLYFGVKFYAEDPCKLKEEITRCALSGLFMSRYCVLNWLAPPQMQNSLHVARPTYIQSNETNHEKLFSKL